MTEFSEIKRAIKDLREGKMIIVVDDEDRENEGDFVMAAQFVQAEDVVFFNRKSSGIITIPMPESYLKKLKIPLMVEENKESMRTAFTVTVDAKEGTTTGSSAFDRALTIRKLADRASLPGDFLRPGHVNPLRACPEGLKKRRGHTEAAIELMREAGLEPVGALCEIMNDRGEMSRLPELREIAREYSMELISIEKLIDFSRVR